MVPTTFKNEQEILLKYKMGEKNELETEYMGQDSVHEVEGTEAYTGEKGEKGNSVFILGHLKKNLP